MNDINKIIRDNLKSLRLENDLTQEDVAKYLKINRVDYTRYETGARNFPVEIIDKLADFYKTSIDDIFGK